MKRSAFLTAEWRYLAMMNYEVEPDILLPYAPPGTELDSWNGKTFVSIVGFLFLHTKILGLSIPFHQNFEEVNLRFYVRRLGKKGWQRGVVFIKEIVPKPLIAAVARIVYNEKYISLPMQHILDLESDRFNSNVSDVSDVSVEYRWSFKKQWNHLGMKTVGGLQPAVPEPGSQEEFITEHYWGYTIQRDGGSIEYRVEHPAWRVWQVSDFSLDGDVAEIYGSEFVDCLNSTPSSAFLAEGSPVIVRKGVRF